VKLWIHQETPIRGRKVGCQLKCPENYAKTELQRIRKNATSERNQHSSKNKAEVYEITDKESRLILLKVSVNYETV
jgi:hypothetical protein